MLLRNDLFLLTRGCSETNYVICMTIIWKITLRLGGIFAILSDDVKAAYLNVKLCYVFPLS